MWMPLNGFEGLYCINEFGEVLGLKRNNILKQHPDKRGYLTVYNIINQKKAYKGA